MKQIKINLLNLIIKNLLNLKKVKMKLSLQIKMKTKMFFLLIIQEIIQLNYQIQLK